MRNHKILNVWGIRIAFMCMVLNVAPCFGHPSMLIEDQENVENQAVQLEGDKWRNVSTRSSSPVHPTVLINENMLIVQSTLQDYDITISIIDEEGYTIYEQTVPAAATSYITIPLGGFPSGTYTLVLRNPSGGYLYGNFSIN